MAELSQKTSHLLNLKNTWNIANPETSMLYSYWMKWMEVEYLPPFLCPSDHLQFSRSPPRDAAGEPCCQWLTILLLESEAVYWFQSIEIGGGLVDPPAPLFIYLNAKLYNKVLGNMETGEMRHASEFRPTFGKGRKSRSQTITMLRSSRRFFRGPTARYYSCSCSQRWANGTILRKHVSTERCNVWSWRFFRHCCFLKHGRNDIFYISCFMT